MTMHDRINNDLKGAIKSGDERRKLAIRSIKTAIQRAEVAGADRTELTDEQVMAVIRAQAKQRRDSIEEFNKAKRVDLVAQEQQELTVIEEYLPSQMGRTQVEGVARAAIAEVGATSPAQMGRVMRVLMPKVKDQADGRLVNEVVRELLSSSKNQS